MNNQDRDNLKFLLSIDEQGFLTWVTQASDDDFRYAMELIDAYNKGIAAYLNDPLAQVPPRVKSDPYTDANLVLSKFRLKH